MNHTLMKSGLRSSSRATSCRASSPELIRTIGGSPRSNFGSSTMEMSGPVTATRGAAALLRAASRTWKFQNGPPTSATLVTPLASQTLKVCGSRPWLRCTSDAYGRHARCRHGTPERSRKHRLAAAESGHGSAPKDNAAANCSARPTGSTRIFSAPCPIQPIFESPHHGYGRRRQLWLQRAEYDLDRVPFRHVQLAIERHSVAALRRLQGDRLPWQPGEAWHRWHP